MQVHPRIRQRIRQNWVAKEAEIEARRNAAVVKLNNVLGYLREANIYSKAVDVDDLIVDIELVRNEFVTFQISAENPISIRDAIAPRIGQIYDKLQKLELEHATGADAAPVSQSPN